MRAVRAIASSTRSTVLLPLALPHFRPVAPTSHKSQLLSCRRTPYSAGQQPRRPYRQGTVRAAVPRTHNTYSVLQRRPRSDRQRDSRWFRVPGRSAAKSGSCEFVLGAGWHAEHDRAASMWIDVTGRCAATITPVATSNPPPKAISRGCDAANPMQSLVMPAQRSRMTEVQRRSQAAIGQPVLHRRGRSSVHGDMEPSVV